MSFYLLRLFRFIPQPPGPNIPLPKGIVAARKHAPRAAQRAAIRLKYRHFPELAEAILRQHATYNRALDELEAETAAGRLLVIRPSQPLAVGRYSQDRAELERLYQNGWSDAAAAAGKLRDFLSP